jgi:hypothetical protein
MLAAVVIACFTYGFTRGFIHAARSDPERHEIWRMTKTLLHRRETP